MEWRVLASLALSLAIAACSSSTDAAAAKIRQVIVTPATLTLHVGETGQLHAAAQDEGGNAVSNAPVNWQTSDSSVISIDASGLVTAKQAGYVMAVAFVNSVQSNAAAVGVRSDLTGTYDLVSVNGASPPVPAGTSPTGCPQTYLGGTLTIARNGEFYQPPRTFDITFDMHVECPFPQPGTTTGSTHLQGNWMENGTTITMTGTGTSSSFSTTTSAAGRTIRITASVTFAGPTPPLNLVFQKH